MAPNIQALTPLAACCPRFATIDRHCAIPRSQRGRNRLVEWAPLPTAREKQMEPEPKLNVTTRQVLNDLAFTAVAALATGGAVGGIAFLVVRFFVA
jgi:hypothetical protein